MADYVTQDQHRADLAERRETMIQQFAALRQDMMQQFGLIQQQFAQIDTRFAQIDTRFAHMDAPFAQTDTRFAHLEAFLAQREARLTRWVLAAGGFGGLLGGLEGLEQAGQHAAVLACSAAAALAMPGGVGRPRQRGGLAALCLPLRPRSACRACSGQSPRRCGQCRPRWAAWAGAGEAGGLLVFPQSCLW